MDISVSKWCIVGYCLMHCGICEMALLSTYSDLSNIAIHWVSGKYITLHNNRYFTFLNHTGKVKWPLGAKGHLRHFALSYLCTLSTAFVCMLNHTLFYELSLRHWLYVRRQYTMGIGSTSRDTAHQVCFHFSGSIELGRTKFSAATKEDDTKMYPSIPPTSQTGCRPD